MDRLIQFMGAISKVDAVCTTAVFRGGKTVMRHYVEDKSSQWAELQEVHMVTHFVQKDSDSK